MAPVPLRPYNHVAEDCGAGYLVMTPPAERWKATNCCVLLSINWPTTVPSSLTPLTWLREYPGGAENVSKVQDAWSAACITAECKRRVTAMAETERRRPMEFSVLFARCSRRIFRRDRESAGIGTRYR